MYRYLYDLLCMGHCFCSFVRVYCVLLIIHVLISRFAYYPCKKRSLLMANYKGGKQCVLLRSVESQQKSQTIEVNNKHKLHMYYIYNK
jgi:hypothetical protein